MIHDPKLELHLHLEGAAPPAFIRQLGDEKGIRLDGVFDSDGAYSYSDFKGFLDVYEAATRVLQSPEDFARLTTSVLEQSREQGVIYTEVFISPDFCGGRDLGAWRDYLAAIQEAAAAVDGIEMRGVVTCIRHFGPDAARETAKCAVETAGDFITGFGMGGNEGLYRAADFAPAFAMAGEAGLGLTSHAGEFGGPASVRETLDHLNVSRVGHGVRAIEDVDLMRRLADEGVHLEVCPGSNVVLGVYANIDAHPIDIIMKTGVPICVSTDDPPFFHTTLPQEYAALNRAFGWDAGQFRKINRMAAEAAFCDAATRADIIRQLEA
ncbi:adenosine deaminase [Jannaschia faecimaris]|uniref:Adenosine deaminase n=1 Tax=Jannaschia faecimaris TaxID=1244108 RepID=A0A1H3RP83_9RHOB|nr:adenosine deaminase [Jannaschia faecimaris]SDZ27440.1 adenosine deaminase [Jannaschia faecimaris]